MGDGFRVRVRAKGWLGFTYYGPKLLKLRLRSGGGFGKKQNRADNHSKSPIVVPIPVSTEVVEVEVYDPFLSLLDPCLLFSWRREIFEFLRVVVFRQSSFVNGQSNQL